MTPAPVGGAAQFPQSLCQGQCSPNRFCGSGAAQSPDAVWLRCYAVPPIAVPPLFVSVPLVAATLPYLWQRNASRGEGAALPHQVGGSVPRATGGSALPHQVGGNLSVGCPGPRSRQKLLPFFDNDPHPQYWCSAVPQLFVAVGRCSPPPGFVAVVQCGPPMFCGSGAAQFAVPPLFVSVSPLPFVAATLLFVAVPCLKGWGTALPHPVRGSAPQRMGGAALPHQVGVTCRASRPKIWAEHIPCLTVTPCLQ